MIFFYVILAIAIILGWTGFLLACFKDNNKKDIIYDLYITEANNVTMVTVLYGKHREEYIRNDDGKYLYSNPQIKWLNIRTGDELTKHLVNRAENLILTARLQEKLLKA